MSTPPPPERPGTQSGGVPEPQEPAATQPLPEQVLATIGDIRITVDAAIAPNTRIPLRGSTWTVQDAWSATQRTPTWAIVAAVLGFFCLFVFSLLFLLARETVYSGIVQVTVTRGPQQHITRIPVVSQAQVQYVHQQVNWVRSLSA